MEAIFLFLVSAAGVSHCQASDVPSAGHGFSNSVSTTPSKHPPPRVTAAPPSTSPRASVFYDGSPPPRRHTSRDRSVTSSHGDPSGIGKSSLTLSQDYLEKILDDTGELEWFQGGRYSGGPAVLTTDVYQGKRMLVYKLAPGDVFAGKRTAAATRNHEDIKQSQSNAVYFDGYENPHEYSDSKVVLSGYRRYKGNDINRNFIRRPISKWSVQYLKAPQPLASMANPYLPSGSNDLSPGFRARPKHKPGRRVKAAGTVGGAGVGAQKEVVAVMQRQVAKTVQAARNAGRGVWLSLLLLHYLGFLPQLPGLPRHTDPDEVTHTVVNTP
ncbi:uncharacterized protein [Panulirus ornatus]|uniref:uncharacterized protein n=1 Tax=Panulirus ornatus TaxID=150431 RepID=UPI003A846027